MARKKVTPSPSVAERLQAMQEVRLALKEAEDCAEIAVIGDLALSFDALSVSLASILPTRRSTFVKERRQITSLVDDIYSLPITNIPALYIDLEGAGLSRKGTISLMSIFVSPLNHVYLVDVFALQTLVFTTPGSGKNSNKTLKTVLESRILAKVFFDVRNDSDALFFHFGIDLNRIIDVQLMELAIRPNLPDSKMHLLGLGNAISRHAPISPAEKERCERIKKRGLQKFAPEQGGSYAVFVDRPLSKEMIEYCEQDVTLLPGLYEVYSKKLDLPHMQEWRTRVLHESIRRAKSAQRADYIPNGRQKSYGPW